MRVEAIEVPYFQPYIIQIHVENQADRGALREFAKADYRIPSMLEMPFKGKEYNYPPTTEQGKILRSFLYQLNSAL